jgi:hypothetical protein
MPLLVILLIPLAMIGCAAPPAAELEPLPTTPPPALDLPVAAPTPSPPPPGSPPPAPTGGEVGTGPHLLWVGFGGAYWPEMEDLDPTLSGFAPADFGEFDDWGFGMNFGYQGRIAEFERSSLWLGGEFGFASFENDRDFDITFPSGEIEEGTYTADLFYIAPTLACRVPFGSLVEGYARGGAGYYSLSLYESFWGYGEDIDDDDGFGGFVALGIDIRMGETPVILRIEDVIHFVDLDPFPDVLVGEDEVNGPLQQFLVGLGIRF